MAILTVFFFSGLDGYIWKVVRVLLFGSGRMRRLAACMYILGSWVAVFRQVVVMRRCTSWQDKWDESIMR